MASYYNLDVVTPERVLLSDRVSFTVAPGTEGELGILAGHAPLMTALNAGVVRATLADGRTTSHVLVISGGFMEVTPERTTILAEHAERADEIDVTRAEADLAAAREMYAAAGLGTDEHDQARQAVRHAEVRIRAGRESK